MNSPSPTSAEFFDRKYRHASDPWNFATDAYELNRYKAILDALHPHTYRRACEPGCSIGVLTAQLAAFCGRVDASDFSATAVEGARARCAHLPNVSITCAALQPDKDWAGYDLVVLSEIGYYFQPHAWQAVLERLNASLEPAATLLACHWLGDSPDHIQTGDEVHEAMLAGLQMACVHSERHPAAAGGFRLEVWRREG